MKTLVIGDIHSCYNEMMDLIEKSGISDDDRIIALGDIIDRGPPYMPVDVIRFFQQNSRAVSVMGNHERKHIRSYKGEIKPALSQVICRNQIGEADYQDAISYFESMPLKIELDEAILIHGYWEPGISIDEQKTSVILGTTSGGRYLESALNGVSWYELYDGEKPLIAGHLNYNGNKPLVINDKVFLIETDCCCGGVLTGIVLPDFKMVSVKANINYWDVIKEQNRGLYSDENYLKTLKWNKLNEMIDYLENRSDLRDEEHKYLKDLLTFMRKAESVIESILNYVFEEHDIIMMKIKENHDPETLSPKDMGRVYSSFIGVSEIKDLLHPA